jgi:excisionase family DNA binding protein
MDGPSVSASVPTAEEFAALAARVEVLEALLAAPAEPREWLTIPQAAQHTGLSEAAVRKLIDRLGLDKHQEVRGGRVLVRRADLDTALTNRRRTP